MKSLMRLLLKQVATKETRGKICNLVKLNSRQEDHLSETAGRTRRPKGIYFSNYQLIKMMIMFMTTQQQNLILKRPSKTNSPVLLPSVKKTLRPRNRVERKGHSRQYSSLWLLNNLFRFSSKNKLNCIVCAGLLMTVMK